MGRRSAITGLCALAAAAAVAGCGTTATESGTAGGSQGGTGQASATTPAAPSSLAVPDLTPGPRKTIADYVAENKIIESPVQRGEPGTPTFDFPIPPDWRGAGAQKPDWAYGAIVYEKAVNPDDPPFVTAIVTRLTGDVEAAKVLQYAPGLLENLPGYQADGEINTITLSGFEAIQFQGSYLRGEERRYIAQETVVIPGDGGELFVLQLNADAPIGQEGAVQEAARVINAETAIRA